VGQTFVNTTVPAGDCLWFNNKLVPDAGICDAITSSGKSVVVAVTGQTVTFASGGTPQSVMIPDGVITFSTDASVAPITVYDTQSGSWQVRCRSRHNTKDARGLS
jgi:hypothetical protein